MTHPSTRPIPDAIGGRLDDVARAFMLSLFKKAVASVSPELCVPAHLPPPGPGRTIVVGAGKASAAMAQAFEAHWQQPATGVVVTRYGHAVATRTIRILEAAHPVPDQSGVLATQEILAAISGLTSQDQVICLISGGGSAVLVAPGPGLTLADKQSLTRQLLLCGASISEINCVRKHLSAVKGGKLAKAACPAKVTALIISDVPGDDIAAIASGPTAADPTSLADALAVLERYRVVISPSIRAFLSDPANETSKPTDPWLKSVENRVIATPRQMLDTAASLARAAGFQVIDLGDRVEGDARAIARDQAQMALNLVERKQPFCILSGGETTVIVNGTGRGGRNGEFILALAQELDGAPGIYGMACDTDGIDGSEDNAGAMITPGILAEAARLGLDLAQYRDNNDSYGFFQQAGGLIVTGPTHTNVNDLRAIFVNADSIFGR